MVFVFCGCEIVYFVVFVRRVVDLVDARVVAYVFVYRVYYDYFIVFVY